MENPGWKAKPDVLLVAENGGPGGIGRYCVDLAQAMGGHAAIACLCPEQCSEESHCWLAHQCRVRDVRLVSIRMGTKAWMQGLRGLSTLWKAEGRPIVHVNGRRGNFIATLARHSLADFAFVTTVHGVLGLHARRNAAYRMVDLGASRAANAVIAVSADTRRRLVAGGVPLRQIMLITNGLALDDLNSLTAVAEARVSKSQSADGFRIGFVGRLSREKGIDDFAEMARVVSEESTTATFVVAGDGPLRAEFIERSRALITGGRLDYLGAVCDLAPVLSDLDVLVMPSRNEGLPYALLEGMAAGCAVVAFGVGGVPEVVADDSLGCLVRPHDFGGLVDAVSCLIAQPTTTRAIGARASAYIREHFSLSQRLPELMKAYERCDPERVGHIATSCDGRDRIGYGS